MLREALGRTFSRNILQEDIMQNQVELRLFA